MRLGSSTTAAATTGPASGPLPASSQPATGQMPWLSARRSRRKLGRKHRLGERQALRFFAAGLADLRGLLAMAQYGPRKRGACQRQAEIAVKNGDFARSTAAMAARNLDGTPRVPHYVRFESRAEA